MRRLLFNLAAFASLALFMLTVAAWARSHWRADVLQSTMWEIEGPSVYNWYFLVYSAAGGLEIACDAEVRDRQSASVLQEISADGEWKRRRYFFAPLPPEYPSPLFGSRARPPLGFWFRWSRTPATIRREVIVPYWSIALSTAVLPALSLIRRRRRRFRERRAALGFCAHCGYDVRASRDRCPECGAAIATPAQPDGGTP